MARFDLTDFEWSVIEPLLPSPQDDRQSAIGGFSHKPIRQNQASSVRAPAIIGTSSGSLHHRIAATHRAQKMIANMRRDIAVAPASELQANSRGIPDY